MASLSACTVSSDILASRGSLSKTPWFSRAGSPGTPSRTGGCPRPGRRRACRGAGPDRDDLLLDRERAVLRLLEQLDQAGAALELRPRGRVQVGGEGANASSVAVLRQVETQRPATFFIALTCAAPPTRETEIPTLIAGRTPGLNRSVSRKIWPSVIEMTLVGMNAEMSLPLVSMIGRPVIEPRAQLVGELRAALEQPGVQVEDVARVRLAARRAAQQQRDGAVGLGLLGQVVEDDEDVLALVHPVLADGRAGVRGEVLEAGRVGGRRGDDGRVLQRAVLLERALHRGDGRGLLTDRDVDAADLLLRVAGVPVAPAG